MKHLLLITTLMVLSTQSYAWFGRDKSSGNDGGGGGGVCIEKKCMTLAEAGFRVQSKNSDALKPAVSSEVYVETNKIIVDLGLRNTELEKTLLYLIFKNGPIDRAEESNSKKAQKFKKEYFKLLNKENFDAQNFELFAFSTYKPSHTYLLPSYDQLNTRSKALILIHEMVVRMTGSITKAIEFDGYILDHLNGQTKKYVEILTFITKNLDDRETSDSNFRRIVGSYILQKESEGRYISLNDLSYQKSYLKFNDPRATSEMYENEPELWNLVRTYIGSHRYRGFMPAKISTSRLILFKNAETKPEICNHPHEEDFFNTYCVEYTNARSVNTDRIENAVKNINSAYCSKLTLENKSDVLIYDDILNSGTPLILSITCNHGEVTSFYVIDPNI